MMNPTLNREQARVLLDFLMASAMETFDDLGYSQEVKDKFMKTFHEKIKLEAERMQNGD
tara:strand:+ start:406 stop:582 length:177 start_codon:yes stop_codon:yes gene_type:complete